MPPLSTDHFPQLEALDVIALNERYNVLRDIPDDERTDEHLLEMISITGILRRKSAGPPRPRRTNVSIAPTLDQL